MRKSFVIISTFLIFLFTSCSNLFNTEIKSFDFSIDEKTSVSIQKSITENSTITDEEEVLLTCYFDKINIKPKTINLKLKDLSKVKITFNNIPLNKKIDLKIIISKDNIPLYEGIQEDLIITNSDKPVSVSINLQPAKYKITYVLNGGTNNPSNPDFYTLNTIQTEFKDPTPAKEGVNFLGWYTTENFKDETKKTTFGGTEIGNITVFAKWSGDNITKKEPPLTLWSINANDASSTVTIQNDNSSNSPIVYDNLGFFYDFCYDNDGYTHFLYDNGYTTTNPNYTEIKNQNFYTNIEYDSITNKMYVIHEIYGGKLLNIYDHTEIALLNSPEKKVTFAPREKENILYLNYAISDNTLFVVFYNNAPAGIYLAKYSISADTSGNITLGQQSESKLLIKNQNTEITTNNRIINEVLIKNNKIYILTSSADNDYYSVSKGSIIVCNIDGSNPKEIGWTNNDYPTDKTTEEAFFGPLKFISIKDNELLIADDGVYGDGSGTNVNRIVTFNTDSNKITNVNTNPGVTFNDEFR